MCRWDNTHSRTSSAEWRSCTCWAERNSTDFPCAAEWWGRTAVQDYHVMASANQAFTDCVYAVHSPAIPKTRTYQRSPGAPKNAARISWLRLCPAAHRGFQAARNPIVCLGCLLSPQWHLKKVWEKRGGWKSEPKLINQSIPRKCMQQKIRKLQRASHSTVTNQGWGRQKQGKSSKKALHAIWTHLQCWQAWLVWSIKEMATCNCTVVIQSFQSTIKHANFSC